MFGIEKYSGIYEDKDKKYIETTFSNKEDAIKVLDDSKIVHEINIISPIFFY